MAMDSHDQKTSYIRDVWQDNLESEMVNIREMVVNFPCISMVCRALSASDPHLPAAKFMVCSSLEIFLNVAGH